MLVPNGRDPKEMLTYRVPTRLSRAEHGAKRALLVGSCTVAHISGPLKLDYGVDTHFLHIGQLHGFDWSGLDGDFDFEVVSLPMDHFISRHLLWPADLNEVEAASQLFSRGCDVISDLLDLALYPNREKGLLTFVCNLLVPQQNPLGRLLPRYDLRNIAYLVDELNRFIARRVADLTNVYVIDADGLSATFGRMRIQDDSIWSFSHGAAFSEWDFEAQERFEKAGHRRIEPMPRIEQGTFADRGIFYWALSHEVIASYRTIRQRDQVKVVVFDLDDTIWRGIAADPVIDDVSEMLEGIHYGIIEALLYLEARGIALAIVSKNDEARVREVWGRLLGRYVSLEKFVSIKINWDSKADNIEAIAAELNVGLNSIVFVDDHPREREEVAARLPQVRIIGWDMYAIRRDLLWSPETQVRVITEESRRKTEMLRGQIVRETMKKTASRADFLQSLSLRIEPFVIREQNHRHFTRSVELINKTNQFNTTGVRWNDQSILGLLRSEGYIAAFSAADRTTDYGVIAVALVLRGTIEIFVMSCRVIGLEVEIAALRLIERIEREAGVPVVRSRMIYTDSNTLSRDFFVRAQYIETNEVWERDIRDLLPVPEHIAIDSQQA